MEAEKPPKYLYKYRGWNKHTRAMIEKGELWFQDHKKLNDPFEMRAMSELPRRKDQRKKLSDDLANQRFPGATKEEKRVVAMKLVKQMASDRIGFSLQEPMGFFCLSEVSTNTLMWSHYSTEHEGICLQFNTSLWSGKVTPLAVEYKEELPIIPWDAWAKHKVHSAFIQVMLTKAKTWEYEQERRIIRKTGLYQIEAMEIASVIVGACCPADHRKEIKEVCDSRGVKVYEARLSETKYAIEIPGLDEASCNE